MLYSPASLGLCGLDPEYGAPRGHCRGSKWLFHFLMKANSALPDLFFFKYILDYNNQDNKEKRKQLVAGKMLYKLDWFSQRILDGVARTVKFS